MKKIVDCLSKLILAVLGVVDGPENGGEFQKIEVEGPVFQVKEGDGNWYQGSYGAGAVVTMIKK